LLPFQRIQVSLGALPKSAAAPQSASEVYPLRGAEWAGGHAMLTGNALFSGYYLNELLIKLLARHDAHPILFDAYAATLPCLSLPDEVQVQAALRAFELVLLQQVGVLPDLSVQTQTQQLVDAQASYSLQPELGVMAARPGERAIEGQVLIGIQAALQHGSVPALQQACRVALPEVRQALRALLHYHLGSNILRTRQVMRVVQHLDR
jgi:DNA repair protein RecO (recombination protein O)